MEVQCDAGEDTDLTMECDEDEPSSGQEDEGQVRVRSFEEETRTRIICVPKQLLKNCSTPTLAPSAGPLGFRLNGQLVSLLPGGGTAEWKLCSQPRGSVSGFSLLQLPVNTTAPPTDDTPCPEPESQADSTPIITGVISGEEAQKVLNRHNVDFTLSLKTPPLANLKTPPLANPKTPPLANLKTPPLAHLKTPPLANLKTPPLANLKTPPLAHLNTMPLAKLKTPPHNRHAPPTITQLTLPAALGSLAPPTSDNRTTTTNKVHHKGQQRYVSPPNCLNCASHHKFIKQLRGFMCLCSPGIAQSLENLKKKKRRSSREVKKTTPHRSSDDVLSDPDSPALDPASSPLKESITPPPSSPQGKLVMLVEDFYYGSALGQSPTHTNWLGAQSRGDFCCVFCPTATRNNIELMNHTLQHRDTKPSCPHCYRRFLSPLKLQCHLEGDHSQCMSSVICRICERNFGSEPRFLLHMKRAHKPGEMPYVCQVCDFRSSFYSDVWSHFEDVHADTKYLLCHYCLKVLGDKSDYQNHVTQHQRKYMFDCDRCRLHFLCAEQRKKHQELHDTYLKPAQLTGLKPGTKVTVRTYSEVGGAENDEAPTTYLPCKVIKVDSPSPPQEVLKRKRVESLAPLLSSLSENTGVSLSPLHCVECLSTVRDIRSHFPSLVHCSLCRFITCCSTSYANHMINNHVTFSENQLYQSIYLSNPRTSHRLECVSCNLCTYRGDVMANHLTERPEHECRVHIDRSIYREQHTHTCDSVTSAGDLGHSGFVPIHLMSSSKMTSTQLSVKALPSHSPLCSEPAMTIITVGPCPKSDQVSRPSLSVSQLAAVLSSLCHGVSEAAHRCQMASTAILSWTKQQEGRLSSKKWQWKTARLLRWFLRQREQQLSVSEDVLLEVAKTFVGQELKERYRWSVDFMLRHSSSFTLPKYIRGKCYTFLQSLHHQIHRSDLPPLSIGCMDEFSIFIGQQNPTSFQLFASPDNEPLMDVFLSALSDGTLLTPLIFFRRTPSHLPEDFPSNVLLEVRQDGFSDQERLNIWINKVWRPSVVVSGHSRDSVLLVDSHRGHLSSQFKDSLSSISTDVMVIPPVCSCRLQPLHVCVTPVLQDFLQARWTQLVSQGGLDGLGLDHLALMFTCWLSELCSTLNSNTGILHRSFSSVLDPQVKDCAEAETMIKVLREALIQPLETPEPGAAEEPGPGLGLLQTGKQ